MIEDEDVNKTQDNPLYIPFPEHVPPTLYPVNLLRKKPNTSQRVSPIPRHLHAGNFRQHPMIVVVLQPCSAAQYNAITNHCPGICNRAVVLRTLEYVRTETHTERTMKIQIQIRNPETLSLGPWRHGDQWSSSIFTWGTGGGGGL